jgi:hypothetical protein
MPGEHLQEMVEICHTHVLEAEKQLESEEEFKQTLRPQQVSNYGVALIKA